MGRRSDAFPQPKWPAQLDGEDHEQDQRQFEAGHVEDRRPLEDSELDAVTGGKNVNPPITLLSYGTRHKAEYILGNSLDARRLDVRAGLSHQREKLYL